MKTIILSLAIILSGILVFSQKSTNSKFSYQAVVRGSAGQILPNQNVSFRISLLEGSATGSVVYQEEHTALTTNDFGLVNLEIGGGAPVTGTMGSPVWGSNDYFIQIEMDENGGSTYQLMGVSQLLQVPYAIHAEEAETVNNENQQLSISGNDLTISGTGGNTITIPNELPTGANGNMLMHNGTDWSNSSLLFHDTDKIGISNTTPAARLDISGTSTIPGIRVGNTASTDGTIGIKTNGYFNTNGYLGVMGADNFDGITGLMLDNHRIGVFGYSESGIGYGIYGMAKVYGGYFTNSSTGVTSNVGLAGANAALEVEGGAVFGTETNAAKIMEIIEITGTTDNTVGSWSTMINYPTGWDENNTRVLSAAIHVDNFWWQCDFTEGGTVDNYVSVQLGNVIGLIYTNDYTYRGRAYRITLMRVE